LALASIELLALDVDGVLTDGLIAVHPSGDEVKQFHVRDGIALRWLEGSGVRVALVTGRRSSSVDARARELNLSRVLAGQEDKLAGLQSLADEFRLPLSAIAYMGDDLPDLPALARAGHSFSVPEAPAEVRSRVHYVTRCAGGHGAVREVAELILKARGVWSSLLEKYLP
jgi:3-deoxy-D-manno-octulosonate 8-phosphate phosphatase (KDO 8-P phosphatase)